MISKVCSSAETCSLGAQACIMTLPKDALSLGPAGIGFQLFHHSYQTVCHALGTLHHPWKCWNHKFCVTLYFFIIRYASPVLVLSSRPCTPLMQQGVDSFTPVDDECCGGQETLDRASVAHSALNTLVLVFQPALLTDYERLDWHALCSSLLSHARADLLLDVMFDAVRTIFRMVSRAWIAVIALASWHILIAA